MSEKTRLQEFQEKLDKLLKEYPEMSLRIIHDIRIFEEKKDDNRDSDTA